MTVCSCESRATDTTKTFAGESSLTGSIFQTWTASTGILSGETSQVEISFIRLVFMVLKRILVVEAGCEKFQIYINRIPHIAAKYIAKWNEFKELR